MSVTGIIVNGRVELDEPGIFPEGMRVRIGPEQVEESEDEWQESLREAFADAQASKGRPAREVLKELALRNSLPLEPGE
jgi:hypothetical protein